MLSTTNPVVVVPSPQQPSSVTQPARNLYNPVTVIGWHHQDNTATTTATTTSIASERIKSFLDFCPIRTGSNEAVVGVNSGSNPIKVAPYRLSTLTADTISAVDATKPRSLSAGRTRQSGSGIDLVQDVYDRLGITRGDLTSSKAIKVQPEPDIRRSFLNYRYGTMKGTTTTSASSDSSGPTTRGRSLIQNSADENSDGQPRSRSLSRGRQFRSIWPPSSANVSTSTATTKPSPGPNSPKYRRTDSGLDPVISPNQQRLNSFICSPEEVAAVMLSPSRQNVHRTSQLPEAQNDDELLPSAKGSPSRITTSYKASGASNEDKTASTDVSSSNDGEPVPSGISVKERMRAYSEPTKKTATDVKKTKAQTTSSRNYPPLIDIYAEERMRYQHDNTSSVEGDEEKKDDDIEYINPGVRPLRQRQSASSVDSPNEATTSAEPSAVSRGKGTLLANAFLAAIQTSPSADNSAAISPRHAGPTFSFTPINEIGTDDHCSVLDTGSVSILSSVGSHDEQNHHHSTISPPIINRGGINATTSNGRKSSWLDNRNKQQQQQQRGSINNNSTMKAAPTLSPGQYHFLPAPVTAAATSNQQQQSALPSSSTSIIIERMVEERVQARVAELERRMEQQMRTYMQQMEEKMASKISTYEKEKEKK